jgi:serine/threonine protein kinase
MHNLECLGATRWKRDYDTHASDVWSLGIVLVYMVTGTLPWTLARPTDARYAEYVHDRSFLQSYLPVSAHLLPLLARMLEPDPRKRIGLADLAAQLVRVPYLLLSDNELECADVALRVEAARERGLAVALESTMPSSHSSDTPMPAPMPALAKQTSLFVRLMRKMKMR